MKKFIVHVIILSGIFSQAYGGEFSVSNGNIEKGDDNQTTLGFGYNRAPNTTLSDLRFYAIRNGRDKLYLGSNEMIEAGKVIKTTQSGKCAIPFALNVFPKGDYEVIISPSFLIEKSNRVLQSDNGRSILILDKFKGKNYEFSCRISPTICSFIRCQLPIKQGGPWNYYETCIKTKGTFGINTVNKMKWIRSKETLHADDLSKKAMYDLAFRCDNNKLTLTVDGQKMSTEDAQKFYNAGTVGFRSVDSGLPGYIDDVKIKDLDTGKIVFEDDFERDQVGSEWKTICGKWKLVNGVPLKKEIPICKFKIKELTPVELPKVEVIPDSDGFRFIVNGKAMVPMFYSQVIKRKSAWSGNEAAYDMARKVYNSGIRFFACITGGMKANGSFEGMDNAIAQLQFACPEAYFFLRTSIPVPKDLPKSEHIKYQDGSDIQESKGEDHKTNNSVSLASEIFRNKYMPELAEKLVSHIKHSPFGPRTIGMLINGGGYEGGWGNSGHFPSYLVDTCPAQIKQFSNYLKEKYKTQDALRKAWNDPHADIEQPEIPGLMKRTESKIAGFRDPVESKHVQDFMEMYRDWNKVTLFKLYEKVRELLPDSFLARFGATTLDTCFSHIQFISKIEDDLNDPSPSSLVTIVCYGDRKAGGVSVHLNYAWESMRLRNKMVMEELDMHTPADSGDGLTEGSWEDAAATMRREFAFTNLIHKNAIWYFDMGYTGPWYDNPIVLNEMNIENKVGNKYLWTEHKSVSEAVLVTDALGQNHFAIANKQLKPGEKASWNSVRFLYNFVTMQVEAMRRIGAPTDGIMVKDLDKKMKPGFWKSLVSPFAEDESYKLYLFPTLFYCDKETKERIHDLAKEGAVCVLIGYPGIVGEKGTSIENVSDLTKMNVKFDKWGPLLAKAAKGQHALLEGFNGGERLGGGRWDNNAHMSSWERPFIDDPNVVPLGYYENGKCAVAMKKVGDGAIIYSAVPLTNPKLYRNIAKFAKVHIYLDTDDFSHADNNFLLVHTTSGGKKHIRLKEPAPAVREIFTNKLIGTNISEFDIDLKAKRTAVYFIGNDK